MLYELREKDLDISVQLLVDTYSEVDLFKRAVKNERKRRKFLKGFFTIAFRYNINQGTMYSLSDEINSLIIINKEPGFRTNKLLKVKGIYKFILFNILPIKRIIDAQISHREADEILNGKSTLTINFIVVDKRSRNKGLGSQLLQEIIQEKKTSIVLQTNIQHARRFYQKNGFKCIKNIDDQFYLMFYEKK